MWQNRMSATLFGTLVFGISSLAVRGDESCGDFGTAVKFVATPSEAAKQAKKDQKLVFILHVSGHFEEPQFT